MKRLSQGHVEEILHGSLPKALVSIAVPVMLSSFLQTVYNLTDTYWLARIGTEQLAAINLVTPVQNMVLGFGSGVTVAGTVMLSQCIGAGAWDRARRVACQIYTCAMVFACVCAALLALFTPALVGWMGAVDGVKRYGVTYLRLVVLDMPLLYTINIYQATRQSQGDTVRPLVLNLAGVAVNMVLDPLLIVHFGLDAAGAALATVLAKVLPAGIALFLLTRPHEALRLERGKMRPEKALLKDVLRIGLPTALGGSAMQLGFMLMSRTVFAYGANAMAAYGIGNKINGLISLPSMGIGSAVSTMVGQNLGAGQMERAKKSYRLGMGSAVIFLLVGGLILSRMSVATAIVRLISTDEAVAPLAAEYLSIMAFWCWTNGIHDATCGLFQGAGHTEVTMAVNAARLWLFRFATLFVCQSLLHMGVASVWYAVAVSNALSALTLAILYRTNLWQTSRFQTQA